MPLFAGAQALRSLLPCNLWQRVLRPFILEKNLLSFYSEAVSAEVSILSDYPVAWNDKRHRICTAGIRNRPGSLWQSYPPCNLAVGPHLSVRDQAQLLPDPHLE